MRRQLTVVMLCGLCGLWGRAAWADAPLGEYVMKTDQQFYEIAVPRKTLPLCKRLASMIPSGGLPVVVKHSADHARKDVVVVDNEKWHFDSYENGIMSASRTTTDAQVTIKDEVWFWREAGHAVGHLSLYVLDASGAPTCADAVGMTGAYHPAADHR